MTGIHAFLRGVDRPVAMSRAISIPNAPESRCLHHVLQGWAERTPRAIAIAAPGRAPLTYRHLLDQVESVTGYLNASGIGRNDRVAVALPSGPEMAVAFLAVAAGSSCAPVNPSLRETELAAHLQSVRAKALIAPSDIDTSARSVAEALGIQVLRLSTEPQWKAGVFVLSGGKASRASRTGAAEFDDVALVLQTSGTTSRPKIVPLTQAGLCAAADNVRGALGLSDRDCCLNVMPLFHIHGLVGGLLSSLAAGARVVCTPGFVAPQFYEWLDEFRPSWYTAVPAMHRAILDRAPHEREIIARAHLRLIRSCSSPLPAQVASALESTFAAPVVDAYGMTEASHQITSTPPGRRKPDSVGVAAGTEIAIMDDAGNPLAAGCEGEIVIRGEAVMRGYEDAPEINQAAFFGPWLKTGDLGRLDCDGYLYITGRLKEMINRAGAKIAPVEVEEALLAHSAVKEAVAFAVPHTELGEEPAAAVVLQAGTAATETELRRFAALRLADFKVPRTISIVAEIPRTPTGKPMRTALAGKWLAEARAAPRASEIVESPTALEALVANIWRDALKTDTLGLHDDFFRLGGNSILAAQIIARVCQATDVEVSFLLFIDSPTVAGMAKCIAAESTVVDGPSTLFSTAPAGC